MFPSAAIQKPYQDHLFPQRKYRVKKAFLDARKSVHPVGESWTFFGYLPNGFGEGTAIFAIAADLSLVSFAIDWNSHENNLGIENVRDYLEEAS